MPPVIQVENLSKLYRLGEVSTGTLSHDLNRWWHKVRGKEDPYLKVGQVNDRTKTRKKAENGKAAGANAENGKAEILKKESDISASQHSSVSDFTSDYVYALKDINFSVNQGEVLGVIGRNGAGKSTLLKILSRVTAPTSGNIKVKGRIASLLEVGTGFHPELTARENIFLNGAILGMSKQEIRKKFDEIVSFAEIGKFIDTPVKRYSSGMYVRLAFAVAAHLRPDILIVDEVLAVGDLAFQAKCLAHLAKMKESGTTIMIVSHNMQVISDSCARVIMMSKGTILKDGTPDDVIPLYREALLSVAASEVSASEFLELKKIIMNGMQMGLAAFLRPNAHAEFELQIKTTQRIHDLYVNLHINMPNQQQVIHLRSDVAGSHFNLEPGLHAIRVSIPELPLSAGTYGLNFRLVSVDPRSALLWDSETVTLNIEGFNPLGGIVSTRHEISHHALSL